MGPVELIARVCHAVNRAYCQSQGDHSQLPWDDAPEWQRKSAIAGVEMHLADPDASPGAGHASWLGQKLAEGWGYGPVKDAEAKTHPCMVDFDSLPPVQQAKDFIFKAIVNSMQDGLALAGLEQIADEVLEDAAVEFEGSARG